MPPTLACHPFHPRQHATHPTHATQASTPPTSTRGTPPTQARHLRKHVTHIITPPTPHTLARIPRHVLNSKKQQTHGDIDLVDPLSLLLFTIKLQFCFKYLFPFNISAEGDTHFYVSAYSLSQCCGLGWVNIEKNILTMLFASFLIQYKQGLQGE